MKMILCYVQIQINSLVQIYDFSEYNYYSGDWIIIQFHTHYIKSQSNFNLQTYLKKAIIQYQINDGNSDNSDAMFITRIFWVSFKLCVTKSAKWLRIWKYYYVRENRTMTGTVTMKRKKAMKTRSSLWDILTYPLSSRRFLADKLSRQSHSSSSSWNSNKKFLMFNSFV